MGQRKGVGSIKTFAGMPDRRRKRTAHGAYVELAALALHRQRLLHEYKSAQKRNVEIEEQLRKLERVSMTIQRLAESPDEPLLEALREESRLRNEPEQNPDAQERGVRAPGVREKEFVY
ncbi:MAG: hypothetical protein HY815_30225 [Candidatus Riflebacteria bacterium]|nr:hypothetical protein [Candidatus Riflebacteria bacterium]